MLRYARSQRWRASGRSSVARQIRHSRFIISSMPTDLGRRIFWTYSEAVDRRRRHAAQASRPAEGEPPVPGHAEFTFCDQSIERTFAWLGQARRLAKDYERLPQTAVAMIYAAMSRLMLRRLARLA